jgi:hypothetical protein
MTDKTPDPADQLADAVKRALDAASAATDAAHEAEAVLMARSEAARAMDRTARRSGILAAVAGGASVLVLVMGGLLWLRTSADLRDAGEVQAAAAVAFAERIGEMNGALDRLEAIVSGAETGGQTLQARMTGLVEQLDLRVEEILTTTEVAAPAEKAISDQIERLRADLIEAMAETQLSISERLKANPAAVPAPVAAAAPASAAPAPAAAKPQKKPAARAASSAPPPNPFRYP